MPPAGGPDAPSPAAPSPDVPSPDRAIVAMLGDSRVFDTYYTTPAYEARYGYEKTFPHLLRGAFLRRPEASVDIVHIPDHFRGATVANNILRLALSDPAAAILVEGIWETILTKQHFIDYATRKVRAHPWRRGGALDLEFSSARLAELFMADELSVGPGTYRDRQEALVSYFRRRRRQIVWATLPIPPAGHMGGVHPAGNYKPIPQWGACLRSINEAVVPMVEAWGGLVLDLDSLMAEAGGADACLIDLWHFTPAFHAIIAARLEALIDGAIDIPAAGHVSHRCMVCGPVGDLPLALIGGPEERAAWHAEAPDARIGWELVPGEGPPPEAEALLLLGPPGAEREASARQLLSITGLQAVVLYPEELTPLDNPARADRDQHAILR